MHGPGLPVIDSCKAGQDLHESLPARRRWLHEVAGLPSARGATTVRVGEHGPDGREVFRRLAAMRARRLVIDAVGDLAAACGDRRRLRNDLYAVVRRCANGRERPGFANTARPPGRSRRTDRRGPAF